MSNSRAFLYNTGATHRGTEKINNVTAGKPTNGIGASGGGIWWRGGPNEDLGYVIAREVTGPRTAGNGIETLPTIEKKISFLRSKFKTDASFLSMVNTQFSQSWTTAQSAKTWLNANGYWTSWPKHDFYLGGDQRSVNPQAVNYIASLNNDSSEDTSFDIGEGFNSSVQTIAIQSDGKILVGGGFTTYKESSCPFMVRLNTDGSIDTSFNTGTGFNNQVETIAIQSDGKILVGGHFGYFGTSPQNYITRLNTDGSVDTSFVTGSGFNNSVFTIAIQSDDKILVSGYFSTFNGSTQNKIVRLNTDGSVDTSFSVGAGPNYYIFDIIQQTDGKILVGGYFTTFNGSTQNCITRLNTDGSVDTSFVTGSGFNSSVQTIDIQSDGKILVGGAFGLYNGSPHQFMARLNTDGSEDSTFNIGTGFNNQIETIAIQSDGKILVGGHFTYVDGSSHNRIMRLNTDGSVDSTLITGNGFDNGVLTIAIQSNGKILAGGYFTAYKGISNIGLCKITDIDLSSTFNTGSGFSNVDAGDYDVRTMAQQADGKMIVGGIFQMYNGSTHNRIVRLNTDGSADSTFVTGSGFNWHVNTIVIQSNGKILVGGEFTTYNGSTHNRIVRLNTDGSVDSTFNSGTGADNDIFTIAIHINGKILIGGKFAYYNEQYVSNITRLIIDGERDINFINETFNGPVKIIAIQSDDKILVGGLFGRYGGNKRSKIARLDSNGQNDYTFQVGQGFNSNVQTIAIQPDGKIIVGGEFTSYNGSTQNRIARLNTTGNPDEYNFSSGTGFNNKVVSIAIQSDGRILIGGWFTKYRGSTRRNLVRLNSNGTTDTSFVIESGFNGTSINSILIK